ncbi:MAG TPA: leucyl aminopeptidase [Bacteroidales bacterium]|nr:leucyl aminopeptidase [Bacteroidales bacterium]MDD4235990.1 leucyl aminopeptidase [Bacteroidales bacterium]HRW21043.1 leucyl aminopeptidase [Bacteroidales bacterium]
MKLNINLSKELKVDESVVYLIKEIKQTEEIPLTKTELHYVIKLLNEDSDKLITINSYFKWTYIKLCKSNNNTNELTEDIRKAGNEIITHTNKHKIKLLQVNNLTDKTDFSLAVAEGILLGNYTYTKHFNKEKNKNQSYLNELIIVSKKLQEEEIEELRALISGVYYARNIVNEPLSHSTPQQFSDLIKTLGKESGFNVEVFDKKKIEALKMGGLIAVNKGSQDPPTFSVLEWKPENAKNEKPYVLVGKGVMFDTGGINLKPGNYMDTMKSDKAGAAAVAGTMYSISKAKLPLHVIALIPATDNRPGKNAYVPQDIITMYDGTTVEVLNTDAEGRMILADALAYAKKYKPELVIDLATLTGAAVVAVGTIAIAAMTNSKDKLKELKSIGLNTYERIVELPLWKEYDEQLKSDFADIKNIGGKYAGAITAGKFLEHFTDYPWIHLDIAGTAYLESKDSYRGKNGTGSGVRLLFGFLKQLSKK